MADDIVIMPLQCATQWDSLAHVGYDSRACNDVRSSAVTTAGGATRNSFPKVAEHLAGRGVLLDIPGLNEAGRLEPDYEATAGDLTAAAKENLRIESGDLVLARTGWYQHFLAGDSATYIAQPHPGLGLSTCPWLYDNQVAVIACDNVAVGVRPSR